MPTRASDRTRARLLNTAIELFAAKDLAGTSVAEIAREMGITSQGLYRYYRSKHEIYVAAFEADTEALIDKVLNEVSTIPLAALTGDLWHSVARHFPEHPLARKVFIERDQELLELSLTFDCSLRFRDAIVRECEIAQKHGVVRDDINVAETLDALCYIRAFVLFPLSAQGLYNSPEWMKASQVVMTALFSPVPSVRSVEEIAAFEKQMDALGKVVREDMAS